MGTVNINQRDIGREVLSWSAEIHCCSESLRIVLEIMTDKEVGREHALITLLAKSLERINKEMQDFEANNNACHSRRNS